MIVGPVSAASLAGLILQAAANFPVADIDRMCAAAPTSGHAEPLNTICLQEEKSARDRLRTMWPGVNADDRTLCVGDAEIGRYMTYTEMLGCIDSSREVRKERSMPINDAPSAQRPGVRPKRPPPRP